jgi:hypothetical protein
MVKRITGISSLTLVVLVLFAITALAQTVNLEPMVDGNAVPGEEGFLIPYYLDTEGETIFGVQAEIGFDPAVLSDVAVVPGAAATGGNLDFNVLTDSVIIGYANAIGVVAEGAAPFFILVVDVADVESPSVTDLECLDLQVFDDVGVVLTSACGDLSLGIASLCENPGDIAPQGNPDGVVNVGDAVVALRAALNLTDLTEEEEICADVAPGVVIEVQDGTDIFCSNPDGIVNVGDAVVILRASVGDFTFDCEEGPSAIKVPVSIDSGVGIFAFGITLDYPETVVSFVNAAASDDIESPACDAVDDGDTVELGCLVVTDTGIAGPTELALFSFIITGAQPDPSDFVILNLELFDGDGAEITGPSGSVGDFISGTGSGVASFTLSIGDTEPLGGYDVALNYNDSFLELLAFEPSGDGDTVCDMQGEAGMITIACLGSVPEGIAGPRELGVFTFEYNGLVPSTNDLTITGAGFFDLLGGSVSGIEISKELTLF